VLLALGLLAAGMPCAWVCATAATASAPQSEAAPTSEHVASHCAERAAAALAGADASPTRSEAPAPTPPCQDDCTGCATSEISIPGSALALDASSAPAALAVPASHAGRAAIETPLLALRAPGELSDLPPPDILALTTTLLI
jgi:hypothetical protein